MLLEKGQAKQKIKSLIEENNLLKKYKINQDKSHNISFSMHGYDQLIDSSSIFSERPNEDQKDELKKVPLSMQKHENKIIEEEILLPKKELEFDIYTEKIQFERNLKNEKEFERDGQLLHLNMKIGRDSCISLSKELNGLKFELQRKYVFQ